MKSSTKKIASLTLVLLLLAALFASCAKTPADNSLWENATYQENASLGNGSITFQLEVKAGEKSVTLTVSTDESNLEKALFNPGIIDGDPGAYGLYVKKVNGITADYNTDQSYWLLSQNGEMLTVGAGDVTISGGEHFEFTYTK